MDLFTINNSNFLLVVDYHHKFPIVKKTEKLSSDNLLSYYKIHFEQWLLKKIMSNASTHFISEIFKDLCRKLNIEQEVSSSYHHQSIRQVEACIKFIKCTIEKCFNINVDVNLALLQIRSTPLGPELQSPAKILSYRQIRGLTLRINRTLINYDYDNDQYEALKARQDKSARNNDTFKEPVISTIGLQKWFNGRCWTVNP